MLWDAIFDQKVLFPAINSVLIDCWKQIKDSKILAVFNDPECLEAIEMFEQGLDVDKVYSPDEYKILIRCVDICLGILGNNYVVNT